MYSPLNGASLLFHWDAGYFSQETSLRTGFFSTKKKYAAFGTRHGKPIFWDLTSRHRDWRGIELQEVGIKGTLDHQNQCRTLDKAGASNLTAGLGYFGHGPRVQ